MTTELKYAPGEASKRLILNNPSQARQGAVWGCATHVRNGVPEARAFKTKDSNESASLRDAGWQQILTNPTLRCAYAGLLKACASGTFCSLPKPASKRLTLNNPAQTRQGAVWGCATRVHNGVPEARALNHSVLEEVLFPHLYATLHQQCSIFLGKTDPPVMFFLSFDIVHYLVFVVDAIGESRIFMCPAFEMGEGWIGFEPLAGKGLDSLYVLCNRYGSRERNKNMHVIWHTSYTVYLSVQVVCLFHDDRIELAVMLYSDGLLAAIGAKDYVVERLDITHDRITKDSGKNCYRFENASLRDAGWLFPGNPTLRCACAGLLRVSASGTYQAHSITDDTKRHRHAMAVDQNGAMNIEESMWHAPCELDKQTHKAA